MLVVQQQKTIRINGNGRSLEDFIQRADKLDDFKGMNLAIVTRKGPKNSRPKVFMDWGILAMGNPCCISVPMQQRGRGSDLGMSWDKSYRNV